MAGADVAEVSRRHAEGHFLVVGLRRLEPALEVVHDLGHHPRPVDRIHRADLVLRLEFGIVGHGLDDVLGIIEHAAHGDVENVRIRQGIHLRALKGAHATVGRKHEDAHIVLAAHRIFRRRTGVARGRTEDVDGLAALVQHILEQVAQQLHGHVLEGQRRAVGQFQQVEPRLQRCQRHNVARPDRIAAPAIGLCRVGLVADRLQVCRRDVIDIERENLEGQFGVGKLAPLCKALGNLGIGLGQVKPAIGGETAKQDVGEGLDRREPPGGDVLHVNPIPPCATGSPFSSPPAAPRSSQLQRPYSSRA